MSISNFDDLLDSRDVIDRLDALEALGLGDHEEDHAAGLAAGAYDEDDIAEWKPLRALADEAASSPDWQYGETLIRDSYFTDYARQFAEDVGAIDDDAKWPCTHIDWSAAATALKQDYFAVDFDGVTYWVHA